MSYQTGPATSPRDLLQQFVTFLSAAGWTIDANNPQNTGDIVYITKGAKHFALRSFINENDQYLGAHSGVFGSGISMTGYDTFAIPTPATNWWNQAGAPYLWNQNPNVNVLTSIMLLPAGAISQYWMFADATGDNVVIVANKQAGVYTYLFFGDIVASATLPGTNPGRYFGGSSNWWGVDPVNGNAAGNTAPSPPPGGLGGWDMSFLKVDVDAFTGKWVAMGNHANDTIGTGKKLQSSTSDATQNTADTTHIYSANMRTRATSTLTGALMPMPTHWLTERDNAGQPTGGGWSYIGYIPNIFMVNGAGFVPGSDHTISTDHYIVFPNFCIKKV